MFSTPRITLPSRVYPSARGRRCAPAGPRYHHNIFELYALNAMLDLPAGSGRPELLTAMEGKIVAKAAYVGRFRGEAIAGGAPAGAPAGGRGN